MSDETLALIGELAGALFRPDGTHADWFEVADSGLLALTLPEAAGGAGCGLAEIGAVARALGRSAAPVPLTEAALLPGLLAEDLPGLADGSAAYTTLLDPGLRLEGGRVTGTALVPGRPGARAVAAVESGEGPALVLVGSGREVRLFDGMPGLEFRLEAAPAEVLAGGNAAAARIARARVAARIAALFDTAGATEAAVSLTRDYLPQRKQFGRALSEMQVLRHRLVDMAIAAQEIEATARNAVLVASADPAAGPATMRGLDAALALAARRGRRVAQEAVQLHGGIGVTEEARISTVFRRLTRLGAGFGGAAALMAQVTAGKERLLES